MIYFWWQRPKSVFFFFREWIKLDWSTALNIVHLYLNLTNWPVELAFGQNPLIFTPPDLYHFYKGHENSGLSWGVSTFQSPLHDSDLSNCTSAAECICHSVSNNGFAPTCMACWVIKLAIYEGNCRNCGALWSCGLHLYGRVLWLTGTITSSQALRADG